MFSFFLKMFFLKNTPMSTVQPYCLYPLKKKKKKASEIEFRMKNKSSHQGKYDVQYIAD